MTDTQRAALRAHLGKQDYHSLREIHCENTGYDGPPYTADELTNGIMSLPDDVLESIMKAEGI